MEIQQLSSAYYYKERKMRMLQIGIGNERKIGIEVREKISSREKKHRRKNKLLCKTKIFIVETLNIMVF